MTMRFSQSTPETLTDDNLMTLLRDALAAAQRRPALKPELRQLLAETLGEEKAEMLAGSDLSAAEIAALSTIDPARLMGPLPREVLA